MIEWLPWLPSKSCYTNLKFFETLKDTPNPSKGFRFVAFLVLEILGGPFRPPPWCLVWVPKPLVPGGLTYFNKVKFTRNFRRCSKKSIAKQNGRFVAMVTKDLQTLNLKFVQVMFNSLVLTWETNFEVVFQISVLESYLDIYLFKN